MWHVSHVRRSPTSVEIKWALNVCFSERKCASLTQKTRTLLWKKHVQTVRTILHPFVYAVQVVAGNIYSRFAFQIIARVYKSRWNTTCFNKQLYSCLRHVRLEVSFRRFYSLQPLTFGRSSSQCDFTGEVEKRKILELFLLCSHPFAVQKQVFTLDYGDVLWNENSVGGWKVNGLVLLFIHCECWSSLLPELEIQHSGEIVWLEVKIWWTSNIFISHSHGWTVF